MTYPSLHADAGDHRILTRQRRVRIRHARNQAALCDRWLAHVHRQRFSTRTYRAPTTWDGVRRAIRVWVRYLEEVATTDAPDASTVQAFCTWALRTRRVRSVVHLLQAVRICYRWAAETGAYRDIARLVPYPVADDDASSEPPLSQSAFLQAVGAIAGDDLRAARDRALLWLLWTCPVDTIALHRAQVGDVDLDAGTIRLVTRWRISQAKRRGVDPASVYPLQPRALIAIAGYLEARGALPDAPLFPSSRGSGRLSLLSMRLTVLRALTAAGVRTSGVARRVVMTRYPAITAADLVNLSARLPREADLRAQLRALIHLLAIPDLHLGWERLPLSAVDLDAGVLRYRGRGRAGPVRTVELPTATQSALRRWLERQSRGARWLFPDTSDGVEPARAHQLRQLVWACFSERLPPGTSPRSAHHAVGATTALRRAAIARMPIAGRTAPATTTERSRS